jgi:CheY-like chemotaxis protein
MPISERFSIAQYRVHGKSEMEQDLSSPVLPSPGLSTGQELIKTIVLVDSPQITQPVAQFLRQADWTVYEASNCGQARGLIMRFKPEFVIMELLLPLETGFEFCAYLKKANCRTPVMIFTEVNLEEARNMAMWAGADAYLTKPTDPNRLFQQILTTALRVSFRVQTAETGYGGSITFRCKCGKSLRAGSQHAGRAMICPGCKHLAKCPVSLLDSGTLYRSMMEERLGLRSNQIGIECSNCHKTVDPGKCRVRDHYECLYCHANLKLSADFFEQWLMFFGDQDNQAPVLDFNPLRYVYVQCENCRNLHQYFRDADSPLPCPSCGHQQSLPSIRGVPISRAALASTGRLFEFRFADGRNKLFLLPSRRKYLIGSAPDCAISLQNQPIHAQHCVLRNTAEGPHLIAADPTARISINGQEFKSPTLLKPGDDIQLGGVHLHLHGTPEKLLRKHLSGLLNDMAEKQKLVGELEFSEPSARILQYYWELQRLRRIDYQRSQQSTLSGESSMIHPIDSQELH